MLGLSLGLVFSYSATERITFRLGACTCPMNSEIAIMYRTVWRITPALILVATYLTILVIHLVPSEHFTPGSVATPGKFNH